MKAMQRYCIFLFCFLLLYGCGSVKQATPNGPQDSPQKGYRQRASMHEKRGELQQALMAWQVVQRLDPNDTSIPEKIATLGKEIDKTAEEHYRMGIDSYKRGDINTARNNFIVALRIKPEHRKAFYYLKFRLPNDGNPVYNVVRGDSYTKIATDVYNDPTKAYAIAFFNNLDPQKPLQISTELVLPELPSKYIVPRKEIEALTERARQVLDQQRYDEVLEIVSDMEALQPNAPNIRKLKDAVYYQRGVALLDQKEYSLAIPQLKQVSQGYPGRKEAIDKARRHLLRESVKTKVEKARHKLDGKFYAEAISICQEIAVQDPFNKDANAIFNAAHYAWGKTLLEQGKEADAIKTLSALDEGYEDTAQLLVQARAQLHARAEALYRKGVKFFLNEELEKAIKAWSEVLKLNPDHPKAKQDIENAIRLLDKWRDLDETGGVRTLSP